jgi:heme/copper-type cytochrome/quinol oxidase subunit 2
MITTIPNTLLPRLEFVAPDTGKHWLYFEYDGTYHSYKEMPLIIKKDEKFYAKISHNSDS